MLLRLGGDRIAERDTIANHGMTKHVDEARSALAEKVGGDVVHAPDLANVLEKQIGMHLGKHVVAAMAGLHTVTTGLKHVDVLAAIELANDHNRLEPGLNAVRVVENGRVVGGATGGPRHKLDQKGSSENRGLRTQVLADVFASSWRKKGSQSDLSVERLRVGNAKLVHIAVGGPRRRCRLSLGLSLVCSSDSTLRSHTSQRKSHLKSKRVERTTRLKRAAETIGTSRGSSRATA